MKKLIAFDLDGTLAESKSALTDTMSELLNELLDHFQVCVISGGKFEQFDKQLLGNLNTTPDKLEKLHLMPTCGTRYFNYDLPNAKWHQVYAEDFTETEKKTIIKALQEGLEECGFDKEKTWGEQIEDRGSQITFSALGQKAPVKDKEEWDPDNSKKAKIRDIVAHKIPEFEVRSGGTTSLDITKLGIDKAYGMERLINILEISKDDILFFGDRLTEGGNDYPIKAMGIDSIEITSWKDTATSLQAILHTI